MVESVALALEKTVEAGGEVVTPLTSQVEARHSRRSAIPPGNMLGILFQR